MQDFVHVNGRQRSQTSTVSNIKGVNNTGRKIFPEENASEVSFGELTAQIGGKDTDLISKLVSQGILVEEVAI